MSMVRFFVTVLMMVTLKSGYAQQLNIRDLEKLRNDNLPIVCNTDGDTLGGTSYESKPLVIVFYSVNFDERKKAFFVKGRIVDNNRIEDSLGLAGVHVFYGILESNKLKDAKLVGTTYARLPSDVNKSTFPYRTGDFEIQIKLRKGHKIYFEEPMHNLVEYDINRLKE